VSLFSVLIRYYFSEQIKGSEMSGACGMHGGKRSAYRVLVSWWRVRREDCIGELTHEWKADVEK
jgi:hypothetical protein